MGEWIRFGIVCALMLVALVSLSISIMGVFRFKFALNRIHAASMIDTLVLMCVALALIITKGFAPVSIKIILVIVFQWCTGPIASHMLAKFEYKTDKLLSDYCKIDRSGRD